MSVRIINGFSEIVEAYDAYLIDLWGTVHDGITVYPGVVDCLRRLRTNNRKVLFLSNVPQSSSSVRDQFESFGVSDDCYDSVITSGDSAIRALNQRDDPWHAALGYRFYHLGPARYTLVNEVLGEAVPFESAEYILTTGLVNAADETPEDYRNLLSRALARGLPMVCANATLISKGKSGEKKLFRAGALAEAFREMGGDVRCHGKPYESIYRMALDRLETPDCSRVLMVGDNFSTDIAGASATGIDSIWIAGGLHGEEVGFVEGESLDSKKVGQFIATMEIKPTATAAHVSW